jgi:hypothetical protein
MCLLVN